MTAPWNLDCRVPFPELEWTDDVPGIRGREQLVDRHRWAVVEYAEGAQRNEWCLDGHVGFVIAGALEYEFEDGGDPLTLKEGDAFCLSTGRAHRGRNLAPHPTRIFLIDDPHEPGWDSAA